MCACHLGALVSIICFAAIATVTWFETRLLPAPNIGHRYSGNVGPDWYDITESVASPLVERMLWWVLPRSICIKRFRCRALLQEHTSVEHWASTDDSTLVERLLLWVVPDYLAMFPSTKLYVYRTVYGDLAARQLHSRQLAEEAKHSRRLEEVAKRKVGEGKGGPAQRPKPHTKTSAPNPSYSQLQKKLSALLAEARKLPRIHRPDTDRLLKSLMAETGLSDLTSRPKSRAMHSASYKVMRSSEVLGIINDKHPKTRYTDNRPSDQLVASSKPGVAALPKVLSAPAKNTTVSMIPAAALDVAANSKRSTGYNSSSADIRHASEQPEVHRISDIGTTASAPPSDIDVTTNSEDPGDRYKGSADDAHTPAQPVAPGAPVKDTTVPEVAAAVDDVTTNSKHNAVYNAIGVNTRHTHAQQVAQGSFGMCPTVPTLPTVANNDSNSNERPAGQDAGGADIVHTPGMDTTIPKMPAAALNVAVNSERPAGQDVSDTDNAQTPAQPETFSTPSMDATVPRAPAADIGGTVTGWLPVGWTGSIHGANGTDVMATNAHQEPCPTFGTDTTVTAPVVNPADIVTEFCQRFKTLAHYFSVGRIHTNSPSSTKRVVRICTRKEPIGKARPFTVRRACHFAARRVLRRPGLVVYKRYAITSKLRVATAARAARRGDSQDIDSVNAMAAPEQQEIQGSLGKSAAAPEQIDGTIKDIATGWSSADWTGATQGSSGANVGPCLPAGWSYGDAGAGSANIRGFPFGCSGTSQVANSTNSMHMPTQQVIQGSSGMSASVPAQPTSATSDSAKVLLPGTATTPGISLRPPTPATSFSAAAAPPNSSPTGLALTAFTPPAAAIPPVAATPPVASTPPLASTPPPAATPPAASIPPVASIPPTAAIPLSATPPVGPTSTFKFSHSLGPSGTQVQNSGRDRHGSGQAGKRQGKNSGKPKASRYMERAQHELASGPPKDTYGAHGGPERARFTGDHRNVVNQYSWILNRRQRIGTQEATPHTLAIDRMYFALLRIVVKELEYDEDSNELERQLRQLYLADDKLIHARYETMSDIISLEHIRGVDKNAFS
ncbi:hypothetical protein GGI24_001256 [Coemansia furcata]|nr:hypothetical protein GGI24_001256 [Coemansia furcata]